MLVQNILLNIVGVFCIIRQIYLKGMRLMTDNRIIKVGQRYRHFKGNEYLVLHLAKHSETLEELVVYQALYGERGIWVRPLKMFLELVKVEEQLVYRFEEYM